MLLGLLSVMAWLARRERFPSFGLGQHGVARTVRTWWRVPEPNAVAARVPAIAFEPEQFISAFAPLYIYCT